MSRGITISTTVQLMTESCYLCGVVFAMPSEFRATRLRDKKNFYCPAGHDQYYIENEEDRLRAALEKAEAEAARLKRDKDYLRTHNDQLLIDLGNRNKELKAVKSRAASGTCTECHRHFLNVERHYKSKHAAK